MISNEYLDAFSANAQPLSQDMLTYLKFLAVNQFVEAGVDIVDSDNDEYENAAVLFDLVLKYRTIDVDKPTVDFEAEWEALSGNHFTPYSVYKDVSINEVIREIIQDYENRITQVSTILAINALSPISHLISDN